jgi:hypothetical protein
VSAYTLIPRTQSDPVAEARKVFELHGSNRIPKHENPEPE